MIESDFVNRRLFIRAAWPACRSSACRSDPRAAFTTAFVTGNHENYDALRKYPLDKWRGGSSRRIRPSVILLERGQIFDLGGKRFFTMGGASNHDIQDGILEPDDPLFKKKCRELDARGAMYRVNHLSWWKEELANEEEYRIARANLDRTGWEVDYIITHALSSSSSIAIITSGSMESPAFLLSVRVCWNFF